VENLKIGDACRILNAGRIYLTFDEFAIRTGHSDIAYNKYVTSDNHLSLQGNLVHVLYVGLHEKEFRGPVAIVETLGSPWYSKFIIATRGLGKTGKGIVDSVKEAYLQGKPPTEIIPNFFVDRYLIQAIINENPLDLQYINDKLLTDDNYREVLFRDGGLLGIIPEERRTLELCQIAILDELYAEKFIPEELRSLVKC